MKRLFLAAVAVASLGLPAVSSAQDRGPDRGRPGAGQDRGGVGQMRRGVPNSDRGVNNAQRQQDFQRQQDAQRRQDFQGRQGGGRDDDRWNGRDTRNDREDRFGRNDGRWNDPRRPGWNRNDPNWWRGRPEFRGYNGPRAGMWFFPSYGYIRPDPRFYNYVWRRGDVVPRNFWSYQVVDPFLYGLGWPPPGHQWVYLGRDIVLMQVATGRIVDIMPGGF